MKIDLVTHFVPAAFAEHVLGTARGRTVVPRWQRLPTLVNRNAQCRMMDEFDGYTQVPSLANPPIEAYGSPAETPTTGSARPSGPCRGREAYSSFSPPV